MSDYLGPTGLPYFGHDADWKKVLPAETQPSPRATRSSRTPGKLNEGTIWHAIRRADVCTGCGRVTGGFPGAHAPHFAAQMKVVDCSGRPCVKDTAGYYQVVTP